MEAFLPDYGYRKRDPRYAGQEKHRSKPDPLWDKTKKAKKPTLFQASEFRIAEERPHAICPAGKRLYRNGAHCKIGGY